MINLPARRPGQRLKKHEGAAIIEKIAELLIAGESRYTQLGAAVGISRRRIAPWVTKARKHIAQEVGETSETSRVKLGARLDKNYRDAVAGVEACKAKGDLKSGSQWITAVTTCIAAHARILGIDSLPPSQGNRLVGRIVIEKFEAPSPAAEAAKARLRGDPRPRKVFGLASSLQNSGLRKSLGKIGSSSSQCTSDRQPTGEREDGEQPST